LHTPPVKAPEWGPDEATVGGRIWASQGGLSRNKVAVGESAAGSPPLTGIDPHGSTHSARPIGRQRTVEATQRARCWTPPVRNWSVFGFDSRTSSSRRSNHEPCSLSGAGKNDSVPNETDAPLHASVGGKGRTSRRDRRGDVRRPRASTIQTYTGLVQSSNHSNRRRGYCATWWMARLESRRRTCQAAKSPREPHGG
jgi:hypothetical protein